MSQTELQKLLYAALASGSDAESGQHGDGDQNSHIENEPADLSNCTPAEIIAHYDFRVRTASLVR